MIENLVLKSSSQTARLIIGMLLSVFCGIGITQAFPRGPVTTSQALLVMGTALLVGGLMGLMTGSRWMMLVGPVFYLLAVELGRPPVMGPTVEAVRLDETYGILAFILGKVLPGILSLLPMILGTRLGLILRRAMVEPESVKLITGTGPAISLGVLVVLVGGLAVLLVLPASTPPILDEAGDPVPGSIASLEQVTLGGQEQTILIRAESPDNPVLLYLSGGPGQSDLGYTRVLFQDLTEDFVVVSWDQRGTGKSYSALDPTTDLTFDQAVSDTIELTNHLRERFAEDKIYLLGESYGTILGVEAVQRRPDLYYAWIASGQMVDIAETDRRLFYDLLDYADEHDLGDLREQMLAYGEPPYQDIPYANGTVMGYYEALYPPYTPPQAYIERGRAAKLGFMNILSEEYNLVERVNVLRGLIDMFTIMYPQLQGIDLRTDVTEMEIPIYILDGAAEAAARRDLTLEWFESVEAPVKRIYTFENAAHSVAFEQFQELHRILNEVILPETYPARQQ
ncbi:MAG: alpha/beta hydrolase [Anaerolineales bacterium]|nr:alpha/beta hydrolase [Anaerolineales bacterium]